MEVAMKALPHVSIAAASIGYIAYSWTAKKKEVVRQLDKYIDADIESKLTDADILETISKLQPYAILSPDEFSAILVCLATINELLDDTPYKASTPRELSIYCAEAVEAVRSFRYTLKESYPHLVDEFDQEATEFQNMINTMFTTVLRDSQR